MDAQVVSYALENGPGVALAGLFFWLWRKEVDGRREAEREYLENLKAQIDLWKDLKGQVDAA